MDFIGSTIKQATGAVSASFRLNHCFCGNQDFECAYYQLKTHACDFFSQIYWQVASEGKYNLADALFKCDLHSETLTSLIHLSPQLCPINFFGDEGIQLNIYCGAPTVLSEISRHTHINITRETLPTILCA